ncbi:MAG: lysophospholipid acyltransferase family protein [Gemmataceae bacterium]|nr:lysophospholipid acyltransferase family protein [Gemmataceae bacterium]
MTTTVINNTDSSTDRHLPPLPHRWLWLIRGFRRYVRRYLARHFHAVRLSRGGSPWPLPTDLPLLIVLNHPSWWDPLLGVFLSSFLPHYEHFAVIDNKALKRYPFLQRLGFVGIEPDTYRGAVTFLRYGQAILSRDRHVLWVTAQGRFADVRQRPVQLQAGVAHLATRMNKGWIVPLALEYPFWTERTPEALVRIGTPLAVDPTQRLAPAEWLQLVTAALTQTMDQLATESISRDEQQFTTLLRGHCGVAGWYGRWQRVRSWLRGQRYQPEHAAIMRPPNPAP